MEFSRASCIIYYPMSLIWSSYGVVKYKCFSLPNKTLKKQDDIELKIIEEDYIIL